MWISRLCSISNANDNEGRTNEERKSGAWLGIAINDIVKKFAVFFVISLSNARFRVVSA